MSLLILQSQGKMKLYIFLLLVILTVYDSIKSNPELRRNILKFACGINYKYEGMLAHSVDRFYIVTKFMLPSLKDIKFSNLNFDELAHTLTRSMPHTQTPVNTYLNYKCIATKLNHLLHINPN